MNVPAPASRGARPAATREAGAAAPPRPRLAVFRADASDVLGLGHLVRSATLARALAAPGAWDVRLAIAEGAGPAAEIFRAGALLPAPVPGEAEPHWLRRAVPGGCDLLVVDSYAWCEREESALRDWARRVLVIEDLAERAHDCDLIVDATAGRDERAYRALVPRGALVLAGAGFALLREQFRRARETVPRGGRRAGRPRILVSLGGGAQDATVARVLRAIGDAGFDADVDLIAGWNAPAGGTPGELLAALPQRVAVHRRVHEVAPLLAAADVAVGAAGGSAWERCCVGLPTVLLTTADNQRQVAAALTGAGAAASGGDARHFDAALLTTRLGELLREPERRRRMAEAALRVCDGFGAARVAIAASAGSPHAVWLRRASVADAARLLRWQRHPGTRRYARTAAVPQPDEHRAWLDRKLAAPGCCFNVIMHGREAVGVLRFDREDAPEPRWEVSVNVAPGRQGQGIAARALALRRALLPEARFVADVLPGNDASHRLFAGAGFRWDGARYSDRGREGRIEEDAHA